MKHGAGGGRLQRCAAPPSRPLPPYPHRHPSPATLPCSNTPPPSTGAARRVPGGAGRHRVRPGCRGAGGRGPAVGGLTEGCLESAAGGRDRRAPPRFYLLTLFLPPYALSRTHYGARWRRPPSAQLTKAMKDKLNGYRGNLMQARRRPPPRCRCGGRHAAWNEDVARASCERTCYESLCFLLLLLLAGGGE